MECFKFTREKKTVNNLDKAKRGEMLKTLNQFKWNISAACKHLGISRATYYRNKAKYKLDKPDETRP